MPIGIHHTANPSSYANPAPDEPAEYQEELAARLRHALTSIYLGGVILQQRPPHDNAKNLGVTFP